MTQPNAIEAARARAAKRLCEELTKRINAAGGEAEALKVVERLCAGGLDARYDAETKTLHVMVKPLSDEMLAIEVGFT